MKLSRWRSRPRRIWIVLISTAIVSLGSTFMVFDSFRRAFTMNVAVLDQESKDPDLRPLVLLAEPNSVADQIQTWVEGNVGWSLQSHQAEDDSIRMHLIRTTRVFRFKDDIHVRLTRTDNGTLLDASSQSRVGKGDLGQNARNLRELVSFLAAPSP